MILGSEAQKQLSLGIAQAQELKVVAAAVGLEPTTR